MHFGLYDKKLGPEKEPLKKYPENRFRRANQAKLRRLCGECSRGKSKCRLLCAAQAACEI